MHGRLKVKDSAEKAAEKAREREKKRRKYLAGITIIFEKRASKIRDNESLQVNAMLLQANPDALTLWNCRRETLLAIRDDYMERTDKSNQLQMENTIDGDDTEQSGAAIPSPNGKIPKSINSDGASSKLDDPLTTSSEDKVSESNSPSYPPLPSSWKELATRELSVVSACLQHNPKSYGAWHHRVWVMEQLCDGATDEQQNKYWDSELSLCDLFLTKDERNFHCWDYRRVVVKRGGVAAEQELQYSLSLIERNFSNFSAWHYRSKLLPLLYPPTAGSPHPVVDHIFKEELERVVEAVFTDPSDQSPWFFLRWLLQRQPHKLRLFSVCSRRVSAGKVVLACNYFAPVTRAALPMSDAPLAWISGNSSKYSKVWSAVHEDKGERLLLTFPENEVVEVGPVGGEIDEAVTCWVADPSPTALSANTVQTLEELRENCNSLDDVDPNNKWVLLTLVEVLWTLGGYDDRTRAQEILAQLSDLDPLRAGYYQDINSKFVMKALTQKYANDAYKQPIVYSKMTFDGSNRNLSRVDGIELLSCCAKVDLSFNKLVNVSPLHQLRLCTELILDGNVGIKCLAPLTTLPCLRKLSLNGCALLNTHTLLHLKNSNSLQHLMLKGNFADETDQREITKLFDHLQCLEL